jgi:AICAR transformylase/IMP cyclohydrolase PurH
MNSKIKKQIAELAKSNFTPTKLQQIDLAVVNLDVAKKAKAETGSNIKGFIHQIDNYGLRHAFKRHSKDQLPLTLDDFELIPEIIENYDSIDFGKTKKGLTSIVYDKQYKNITRIVEEIRKGKRTLAFKTMYKIKTPFGASHIARQLEALRPSLDETPTPTGECNFIISNPCSKSIKESEIYAQNN